MRCSSWSRLSRRTRCRRPIGSPRSRRSSCEERQKVEGNASRDYIAVPEERLGATYSSPRLAFFLAPDKLRKRRAHAVLLPGTTLHEPDDPANARRDYICEMSRLAALSCRRVLRFV